MNFGIPADNPILSQNAQVQQSLPDFQLNQVLNGKVLETQGGQAVFIVNAADKTLVLQAQQPINLQAGQSLQIKVISLQPNIEFSVLAQAPQNLNNRGIALATGAPILNLIEVSAQNLIANPANLSVNQMDINLSVDARQLTSGLQSLTNQLPLQLNQIVDAKVLETPIIQNGIALSIADKTVVVQSQQPLALQANENLQLQVVRTQPTLEFKIVSASAQPAIAGTTPQIASPASQAQPAQTQILRLLSVSTQSVAAVNPKLALNQLVSGQQIQAEVVGIDHGKLILQVLQPAITAQQPASSVSGSAIALSTSRPTIPPASASPTLTPPGSGASTFSNAGSDQAILQNNPVGERVRQLISLNAEQVMMGNSASIVQTGNAKIAQQSISQLLPGDKIQLQVVKAGDTPVFNLTVTESIPQISEQKVSQLLRQLLPIQNPPSVFANTLSRILPALAQDVSIPEALKQLARQILASIPQAPQLTQPEQLKQSISQSGLFFESRLAQQFSNNIELPLPQDLKLELLKMVQALNQEIAAQTNPKTVEMLKELLQNADSALAKLTLDQFNSLPNDESVKQGWIVELPFFWQNTASTVRLEIQQDKSGAQHQDDGNLQKNWAVNITITPPELATIHCRISCHDDAINARFWSDAAETVERINTHLDYLQRKLEQQGLKTGYMEAHQGKPDTHSLKKPLTNLFSEKV